MGPVFLYCAPAAAQVGQGVGMHGLRIQPSLSVSETFSDNVTLSSGAGKRSEWTTRIAPSVSVTENSARLRLNAVYTPELLYRASQGTTDLSHFLSAFGNVEWIKHWLFTDVRASISQQNVSILQPQTENNLNVTNNRTTVKSYSISPFLRHDFGFDAIGELRYTHDVVHYGANSGSVSSSTYDAINTRISSGPAYKLFTWALAATRSHLDNNQSNQKIDAQNYSATGGRLITPDLRLNATVGYEDGGYPSTTGGTLKGKYWNIGPTWTPTERTKISATVGRRYYGPSRSFNFEHRSKLTLWSFDYSESVTNTRSSLSVPSNQDPRQFLDVFYRNSITDPGLRAARIDQDLAAGLGVPGTTVLTDSLFVEKRLNGSVGFLGARNTVLANVITSNRSALSTVGSAGDFGTSTNLRQTGGTVTWTSRLTQVTSSSASVSYIKNEITGANRSDRRLAMRVGVTTQIDPKISGSLSLARTKNDSNVAGNGYTENSLTATLGMRF